MTTHDSVLF